MASVAAIESEQIGAAHSGAPADDEISPDTVRALYADAVQLKRSELPYVVPAAILALAAAAAAIAAPGKWGALALPSAIVLFRVGRWSIEWFRLINSDPFLHRRRETRETRDEAAARMEFEARYAVNKPVCTLALASVIALVTTTQLSMWGVTPAIASAALVKQAARSGEWWRLLTASYLHLNAWHVCGNLTALLAFGQLIEAYDRHSRVPLVYLAGVISGSVMSMLLLPAASLGASAGVLALGSYLMILMHRRQDDGARWIRNQMLGVLASTAVLGLVGFFIIDNAAHLGGVLAGTIIAIVAVPSHRTVFSARRAVLLEAAGWTAATVLAAGAVLTLSKLLSHG